MEEKALKELENITKEKKEDESLFPEHDFLATCLRMGLRIEDLKILTFIDVIKILVSFIGKEDKKESTNGIREATKEDIDNLVARM